METKWKLPCPHGEICCDPECFGSYSEEQLRNFQYQDHRNTATSQHQPLPNSVQQQYNPQFDPNQYHDYNANNHFKHHRRFEHHKDMHRKGPGPFHHDGNPFHHWNHHGQFPCDEFRGGMGRGRGWGWRGRKRDWCRPQEQGQREKGHSNQKERQGEKGNRRCWKREQQKSYQKKSKRFSRCRRSSSSSQSFKSMSSNKSKFKYDKPDKASPVALQELTSKGFANSNTNQALLIHCNNNVQKVQNIIKWSESEKAKDQLLSVYRTNFSILQHLGYPQKLGYWKVMAILQRSSNNLKTTIQKLETKLNNIKHNQMVQEKTQDCNFNYVEYIPNNSFIVVDVSNVVRANKHFKKLTKTDDSKQKLEAILRLKILVQTLADGYFVLDNRILDDAAEKEITQKIDVQIQGQRRMQVLYADENLKADDKIVEMVKKLSPEIRSRVLLVTSDRLLIKDCQDIIGKEMPVIGGKIFIKQCKFKMEKGIRNKLIKGSKGEKQKHAN